MTTVKTEIGVHRRQAHHTEFAPTGNISATDVQSAIEEVSTDSAPSDATYYVTSSNANLSAEVVVPAFMQSVLDDTTASDARTTLGAQTQGDVLDDLNTLGAAASDGQFIVATGAGAFAYESGSTVRASLGLTIGSDVQAWDAGLDDISGLAVTDGNIIVGDGANWVAESGATARTSLGLGTIATEAETNYALLAGRSGGQTLIGGTDASDDLVFNSTANATKGTIRLGDATTGLFFDETNSRLAIGEEEFAMTIAAGSVASKVAIHTEGGEAVAELHAHSTGSGLLSGPVVYGARSDGTAAAPTIVVDNDHLLTIAGLGYDGTDYAQGARIDFRVDGTPGAGDMPTEIVFSTSADGSESPTARMSLTPNGGVDLPEISEPANPAANIARTFARDVSGRTEMAFKRSDGTVVDLLRGMVSVKDYGAVGDADEAAGTGTDDTTAIDNALSDADDIYLPAGTYRVTSLSNFTLGKNFWGPGVIWATSAFQTPYYGHTIRAGMKIGNTFPIANHGGVIVGGSGPTTNGVMLKAQNEGIIDFIPTRDGEPMEVQFYSNAVQGYGDFTGTTFDAVSSSHDFDDFLYANDRIWFGTTLYRIDSITDQDTLIIKNDDGSSASTPSDTTLTFWSMYHWAEHTADLSSGVLTVTAGDEVQDWGEDHNVIINGTRYEVGAIDTGAGTYTVTSPPSDATDLTVYHRWYSSEDYINILRFQTLRSSGKEMTFSRGVRPDFVYDRIGATGSGSDNYAYYSDYHFLTGRNSQREQISGEDNMEGEGYTALTVKGQGTHVGFVGVGVRDPNTPFHTEFNYFNASGADNTTKELAQFAAQWAGSGRHRISVLHRNNSVAGFQGYSGTGVSTGAISLQPVGDSVRIGTWNTIDSLFGATPAVHYGGTGAIAFARYADDAFGARLDLIKSRNTTVGSHTVVQSGDTVGEIYFGGSDGDQMHVAALIRGVIDTTPGDNDMPGRLQFFTTEDGASTTTERMRIDRAGNVVVNTAAIATTATDGFLYIPTCAGTPTGTPTSYSGRAAVVYDSTNNLLYVNDGGGWVAANNP